MKILAIMGSPRKGETLKVVNKFAEQLQAMGKVEFKYIFLKDMDIKICRGCFLCLERGEEFCPHREDDRVKIFREMMVADGIIFATPNYSLQVTAIMKNFLDRMAHVFHRPCFFHKAFMPIVTQGVYGGAEIVKYLDTVGDFWGFNIAKGFCVTTPPGDRLPAEEAKIEQAIAEGAKRFYQTLTGNKSPVPKVQKVLMFRFMRGFHRDLSTELVGPKNRDHEYFKERGWLEAPYFYETKLGFLSWLIGKWADHKSSVDNKKMLAERAKYLKGSQM